MARRMIRVGDLTTHAGIVVTGSPNHTLDSRAIARLGDLVDCPMLYPDQRPHGRNKIIEGAGSIKIDGLPVALEGCKTECGCSLIASADHWGV